MAGEGSAWPGKCHRGGDHQAHPKHPTASSTCRGIMVSVLAVFNRPETRIICTDTSHAYYARRTSLELPRAPEGHGPRPIAPKADSPAAGTRCRTPGQRCPGCQFQVRKNRYPRRKRRGRAKIRQMSQRLCSELSVEGAKCNGIDVKVQPKLFLAIKRFQSKAARLRPSPLLTQTASRSSAGCPAVGAGSAAHPRRPRARRVRNRIPEVGG